MPEQPPNSRDTHINPTTEQVPHSGVHGHELPPHDFDMKLPDALEAGAVHHVELDAAGNPVFDLPDTLADFSEPGNSPRTEAYEPLLAPVKEKNGKRRIAAMAAGAVGAAVIGGYGALKLFSNEDEVKAPTTTQPTASAGVEPGQTEPTSPESVQPETAGVGVVGTTLDTLNVPPSEALWQEALRPVMVSEFPTPESAMEHFEDLINIRNVSAEIDSSGELTESTASLTRRAELDSVLFENGTPPDYEDPNKLREIIGIEFWFLNGGGGVQGETPTWRGHWTIDSVTPVGENEYLIDYSARVETNFHELDPSAGNRIIGIETINDQVKTDSLTLENVDGQWFIKK